MPLSKGHKSSETRVSLDKAQLETLEAALARGRDALRRLAGETPPTRGLELTLAASDLADDMISQLARLAIELVDRRGGARAKAAAESVAVIPVGGYGRRELCPRSDIDLLFLIPARAHDGNKVDQQRIAEYVNVVLYGLWDLGFEVGHAVRTVPDCIVMAKQDQAVKTGLLDARLLAGESGPGAAMRQAIYSELLRAIESELLSGKGVRELIEQKLEEADRRRERFGNSIYLLEPNVKASEGGLRELHTALWIARARWRAMGIKDLVTSGTLSAREAKALERAYGFLLRVRSELHILSGRRQDALGFEYQEMIAKTLGYLAPDAADYDKKKHGIERFMRAYYFHATTVRHLSGLIIERATSHHEERPATSQDAPGGFKLHGGTLTVAERDQFTRDPAALVRIFRVAQEEAVPIYSYAKDSIRDSASLIDRSVRRDPEVVKELLAILENPSTDASILDVMHDLGILRRLIPEVARMTAKWQHSLYHVYTVDVHSLFVVKHLKQLRAGVFAREEQELTRLVQEIPRPVVVYLAGFLHDIGKGWPKGDHSVRGGLVAEIVGRRFEEAKIPGWTAEDTADLVWLVREHLTMSDISQRRDVSDHDLIASFAASCATHERLAMLYLLTFADMKGTSPKVWSDWKSTLLREVYEVTKVVLDAPERGDAGALDAATRAAHEQARRTRATEEVLAEISSRGLVTPEKETVLAFTAAMPARYMLSIPARRMPRHIDMWNQVGERGGFALHVKQLRREGTTRLTVVCLDRPGLLSVLAGTLAANRMQILSAQIFSIDLARAASSGSNAPAAVEKAPIFGADSTMITRGDSIGGRGNGRAALDVLYLKDESGGLCDDPSRWARVRDDLESVLFGRSDVKALLDARLGGSSLSKRPKPAVKTEIALANDVSKTETVIDVFCQDRLGVLYTISRALADAGLNVSVAKISTQGDRVADGFYVTDALTQRKIEARERLEGIRGAIKAAIEGPA